MWATSTARRATLSSSSARARPTHAALPSRPRCILCAVHRHAQATASCACCRHARAARGPLRDGQVRCAAQLPHRPAGPRRSHRRRRRRAQGRAPRREGRAARRLRGARRRRPRRRRPRRRWKGRRRKGRRRKGRRRPRRAVVRLGGAQARQGARQLVEAPGDRLLHVEEEVRRGGARGGAAQSDGRLQAQPARQAGGRRAARGGGGVGEGGGAAALVGQGDAARDHGDAPAAPAAVHARARRARGVPGHDGAHPEGRVLPSGRHAAHTARVCRAVLPAEAHQARHTQSQTHSAHSSQRKQCTVHHHSRRWS